MTGDVAQLGERRLCTAEVRGSNPLISTWVKSDPRVPEWVNANSVDARS